MSIIHLPRPIRFLTVILIALLALGVSAPAGAHAAPQATSARWVAIAYSPKTGHWGTASNYETQASAEGAALHGCFDHKATSDCTIAVSTNQGHAALAVSRNGAWAGRAGATLYWATLRARDACSNQYGGVYCKIETTVSIYSNPA